MCEKLRLIRLAIVLVATVVAATTCAPANQLDLLLADRATIDAANRQFLINHVSLILCHLNVKSIYMYFENILRTTIVENLLRDTDLCVPPIVTLIKLVENWLSSHEFYIILFGFYLILFIFFSRISITENLFA